MAASLPSGTLSAEQRNNAAELVALIGRLYPCDECRTHWQALVAVEPPETDTGEALSRWLCRMHNAVNARLGKPEFNCNRASTRWGLECDADSDACGGRRQQAA